jgi:conjugal transfer pilus assembly protein TraI
MAGGEEIPRYPPFLRGLPAAAATQILATQHDLVVVLQNALAFTDRRFAELVLPAVERYAAFVHLLPASEAHHHRGAGGLFRHGLEVACHAAQASQGMVFALDRSPGERRELEPRWRLAAALAGLCHDLGKPVSDLAVTDRDGRTQWRPLLQSLTDWAQADGVDRYFLHWREQRPHRRHEAFGLLVLDRILTPQATSWLTDADPEIMQALLAAVAGLDDGAAVGRLVARADQASVDSDLRENRLDPDAVSLGVPLDRYLVDAMRRLVRGGRWQINVPGARLWLFPEGLHVVWPPGAEDVVALLAADRVPGIPRDPDTLADILIDRALALPCREAGQSRRYWRIAPAPLARDGQIVVLPLLRLAAPALLLSGELPPAVATVPPPASAAPPLPPAPTPADALAADVRAARTDSSGSGAAGTTAVTDASRAGAMPPTAADGSGASAPSPTDAAEDALRALAGGGEVLLALAQRVRADAATRVQLHWLPSGQALVAYPAGLAGLGTGPSAALDALASAGLLSRDPLAPMRKVHEVDGRRGALLSLPASQHLRALVGDPAGEAPDPAAPARPGEGSGASASPPATANATTVAKELVRQLRQDVPGAFPDVVLQDGWHQVPAATVRAFADAHAVTSGALLCALGRLADCQPQSTGAVWVKAAQDRPRAGA